MEPEPGNAKDFTTEITEATEDVRIKAESLP
jgi:hypothetical protein